MRKRELLRNAFKRSHRKSILYRPLGLIYLMISSLFFVQAFYLGEIRPELKWQTWLMATEHFTISNWIFIFFLTIQALFHFKGQKQPATLIYLSEMSLIINNLIVLNYYLQSSTLEPTFILFAIFPVILFYLFNRFSQILYEKKNKIKSHSKLNFIKTLRPNFKMEQTPKNQDDQKTG